MTIEELADLRPDAIVLFGPPMAGKDTVAKRLEKNYRHIFRHFSSGEEFRNISDDNPYAAQIKGLIDDGKFVPDELAMQYFFSRIAFYADRGLYNPLEHIAIINGVPRTAAQVEPFNQSFTMIRAYHLGVNKGSLVERLEKRQLIENREDDSFSKLKRRLSDFNTKTLPAIGMYSDDFILKIDANKSENEVYRDVVSDLAIEIGLPEYNQTK